MTAHVHHFDVFVTSKFTSHFTTINTSSTCSSWSDHSSPAMESLLNSVTSTGLIPALPDSANSPRLSQPATAVVATGEVHRKKIATRKRSIEPWRRPSRFSVSRDLRFEVFFHLPAHSELGRLLVHRAQPLSWLQATLQRQYAIPFEHQRLYFQGEELEGDEELGSYGLQDRSVLAIKVSPRFRRIGDVYSTIRTIYFPSPTSRPDEFQFVEVPAELPPLRIVFQRIIYAITYLTMLDGMQAQRTHRRVWRQYATFWDEPTVPARPDRPSNSRNPRHLRTPIQSESPKEKRVASLVLQASSTRHVTSILNLASHHTVQQRLRRPPTNRSAADLRHLKKWLSNLKYFADAHLPDYVFHDLARTTTYLRVKAGEFVFRQGEAGDSFYVVVTGCISLAAYSTGYFGTLTPGSCFGEISLIEPQGLRTASACVTFVTPSAELAVVSGDLYRRAIKPYKQVVLRATEKAIASIPQLYALPPYIITHLAYAAKSLTARGGRHVVCREEEISVLILLVEGSVKVSKPSLQGQPIVAVIQAPAVFGQEGVLATSTTPAPWELVALETCTLLCLRKDTIASFLSPLPVVTRALMDEHCQRLQNFQQRFNGYDDSNTAGEPKPETTTPRRAVQPLDGDFSEPIPKHRNASIIFPNILERDDTILQIPAVSRVDELARPATTPSARSRGGAPPRNSAFMLRKTYSTQRDIKSSPSCAQSEAQFLSRVLPFSGIVNLQDQLHFVSFERQRQVEYTHKAQEEGDTKDTQTTALLNGLRQIPPEDVQLLPVVCPSSPSSNVGCHYRFVPLNSA